MDNYLGRLHSVLYGMLTYFYFFYIQHMHFNYPRILLLHNSKISVIKDHLSFLEFSFCKKSSKELLIYKKL